MEINHTTATELYTSKTASTTAEQSLDLGKLKVEACQWENADGPYEGVTLNAQHFNATAHTGIAGAIHTASVSIHNVTEVDMSEDDRIMVRLGDGSQVSIQIFRA